MNRWKQGGPALAKQLRSMQGVDLAQAALLTLLSGADQGGRGGGGGKGPHSTGGTSNSKAKEKAEWCCRYADCRSAGRMNRPGNAKCFGCQRAKGEALNPPLARARQPSSPPTFAAAAKAAGKAKAGTAPKSSTAASQDQSLSPQSLVAWEKVTEPEVSLPAVDAPSRRDARVTVKLPAELVDNLSDLKPALGPIVDSLALEAMPRDVSLDSPEYVLDTYLKDVGPCSSAAELEKLEAQIASARTALDVLQGTSAAKSLEQQIAENQSAIARIRKKPTSSEAVRIALGQAKDRFLAARQDKIDVAAKGKAASTERSLNRHTLLTSLQEQLDAFVDALVAVEEGHTQAHAARNADREARDQQVIALFDARIAAAALPAAPATPLPAGSDGSMTDAAAPTSPSSGVLDAATPAVQPSTPAGAHPAADPLLQQLAQEKAQLEAQVAQLQAFAVAEDQFARRAANAPELGALPEFAADTDQKRKACTGLLALLDLWEQNGAMAPFTFRDAQACLPSALPLGDLAHGLLGPLWGLWFDANVSQATVLPKQAVETLQTALERVQAGLDLEQLTPSQDLLDAASSAVRAMAAKRARVR